MNAAPSPSLLPYLQSGDKQLKLEILLNSKDPAYLEKSPFPFLLINESTPFERLMEAKIVTGAGSAVKRLFLLQQSDNYRHVPDEMWPITNEDIEKRWRNVIEAYASRSSSGNPNPILLAGQIPGDGEHSPFNPLFYCSYKDVYFHPPCPKCGDFLQLCRDDTLLAESNLSPYSTSLNRYLYCPKCLQESDNPQFYAYSREAKDPPILKDRHDLINEYGDLILKSEYTGSFPCMNCPELTACYGTDNRVMSRIVPYSFYPFYLLIFEADTMAAPDFLALISGASFETLKAGLSGKQAHGRIRCLQRYQESRRSHSDFIFGGDSEKSFLEVLYLKLSFLGELIHKLFSESDGAVYCDASLAMDRVWIKLADQGGLLPHFWNFNLSILDIWSTVSRRPHLSKFPPAYGHYFLGTIWFFALLVNNRQSIAKVRAALDKYTTAFGDQDFVFSQIIQAEDAGAVFAPENLFWDPASKEVGNKWHNIWNKTLDIGGALLAAAFQGMQNRSSDEFWLDYNSLRTEIKKELFGLAPTASPTELSSDDPMIADILIRLLAKWRGEIQPPATPETEKKAEDTTASEAKKMEALAETVILSPAARPDADASPDRSTAEEETLILRSGDLPPSPVTDIPSSDDDLIQETVILSPGDSAPSSAGVDLNNSGNDPDDLPETVVLSPGGRPDHAARKSPPDNQTEQHQRPDRENRKPQSGAEKKSEPLPDDDDLSETVILKPNKKKSPQDD
jgi:hypothetical protein